MQLFLFLFGSFGFLWFFLLAVLERCHDHGAKCYPCWYITLKRATPWQVEQPVPAEVLLLCFRQVYSQQTQLTATLLCFKLDGL